MGIDIDSYRCMIGTFIGNHSAGVMAMCMPFNVDFSVVIKFIGTVSFVRLLLIMAGIEQNPGPADKYIFKYQYLLVKLGTDVLRKVFDVVVGNNVVQYLTAKTRDIQSLIKARLITADQKLLLPPINKKPDSSKFDITLLSSLLRNICGLRQPNDSVWMNPVSTDTSLEADITRLRICRNQLMHSDQLVLPEADFNSKWQDLSVILLSLNKVAGIVQLQTFIDNAESMDIDEKLREELDQTIKAWRESDRLFEQRIDRFEQDLGGVQRKLEDVERAQEEMKRQHVVVLPDIQKDLVECYKCRCKTLPVSPLFENKDENILNIYKHPTMYSVEGTKQIKQITCFKDIFYKDSKACNKIYITGDAGMGKTSFCTFMCLLWSIGKSGDKLDKEQKELQTDVDYMSKFYFVFYLSLRVTEHCDVIDMIKEQYLKHYDPLTIQDILRKKPCLVLMDGLDEWTPKKDGKKVYILPERIYLKNCVYLTTCRPYRIEQMRLSHTRDIDNKIELTGIHGDSAKSYVEHVIRYMNKENSGNRKADDFTCEVKNCELDDQLCIPMIASHLVVFWYEKVTLTDMPRALIYANILEMLFKRTEQKKVEFPSPTSTARTLQLPNCLSGLEYLNKHVSLLYNVCHLSFRSLFKQDEDVHSLVFTRQQLLAKPYCISVEETEILCKIGILSKNEVVGVFSDEKLKISFLHKNYMEFLAALFISTFDTSYLFSDVTEIWKSLGDVLQFENFFLLLAGLSHDCIRSLIENMYSSISSDLTLCRINDPFHYESSIKSLQNIIVKCYKEASRSNYTNIVLRLDDFMFEDFSDEILRKLLLVNVTSVKSIYLVKGKYYDEFDQITNLQCLHVGKVMSGDYVKFTECMLQNQSTLLTVCIKGNITLIPEFTVRSFRHLTSLSLTDVMMQYNSLHNLVQFLSDSILIENIALSYVYCDRDCTLTLNLQRHIKLTSLRLWYVNILCNHVNTSILKSITLFPLSEKIGRGYIDVFNCIKDSKLECLYIHGTRYMLDYETMEALTLTVKKLQCIKSIRLRYMKLPANVLLQLHSDVTQVEMKLDVVTMSRQCFHCLIESFVSTISEVKVELYQCKITSVDGETNRELSFQESVDAMSEYLTSIPTVNITYKVDPWLDFEHTQLSVPYSWLKSSSHCPGED